MKKNKIDIKYIYALIIVTLIMCVVSIYIFTNKGLPQKVDQNIVDNIPVDKLESEISLKESYLSSCDSITTTEQLISYIDSLSIESDLKKQIIDSIGGPKNITENIILKILSEVDGSSEDGVNITNVRVLQDYDDEGNPIASGEIVEDIASIDEDQFKNTRLQLSTIFIKLNEIDSGEAKNCEEIYTQYNK